MYTHTYAEFALCSSGLVKPTSGENGEKKRSVGSCSKSHLNDSNAIFSHDTLMMIHQLAKSSGV